MCKTEKFINKLNGIGLHLSEDQIRKFIEYYDLMIEWNKIMNLTAITEFDDVVDRHFIDSLAIIKVMDIKGIKTILDVGTGAGFPGIPLKIVFPEVEIVLLDSLNKRIRFLNEVIQKLDLSEIKAIHGRAEDFARNKLYREQFDLCVSRAVANMSTLSEYCIPYVKKDGYFISYKSGTITEELEDSKNAIHILGGSLENVIKFTLPDTNIDRSFVMIHKIKSTSQIYPRLAGKPAKEPLR